MYIPIFSPFTIYSAKKPVSFDKDTFTFVNRYDIGKHEQYESRYTWLHRFCCWALEFEYEKEHYGDHGDSFKVYYYFYNL